MTRSHQSMPMHFYANGVDFWRDLPFAEWKESAPFSWKCIDFSASKDTLIAATMPKALFYFYSNIFISPTFHPVFLGAALPRAPELMVPSVDARGVSRVVGHFLSPDRGGSFQGRNGRNTLFTSSFLLHQAPWLTRRKQYKPNIQNKKNLRQIVAVVCTCFPR